MKIGLSSDLFYLAVKESKNKERFKNSIKKDVARKFNRKPNKSHNRDK